MGALPKRRISTRRQGKRRKAIKLGLPQLNVCAFCGHKKLSHRVCPNCGRLKRGDLKSHGPQPS